MCLALSLDITAPEQATDDKPYKQSPGQRRVARNDSDIAFINSYAFAGYGDFETTRQAFGFLRKQQRADGKMMHELSQSGGMIRWFQDYPYGYYHADTTPLYIIASDEYLTRSGDRVFLKESWESLKKAYSYCVSADKNGDGLIEKHGRGAWSFRAWIASGEPADRCVPRRSDRTSDARDESFL